MRSSQVHNEIGSSTVTNVLNGRYKENEFVIKSGIEIDKNVKL
jgi:lambda repressor-like predicted transcriptional regulator